MKTFRLVLVCGCALAAANMFTGCATQHDRAGLNASEDSAGPISSPPAALDKRDAAWWLIALQYPIYFGCEMLGQRF